MFGAFLPDNLLKTWRMMNGTNDGIRKPKKSIVTELQLLICSTLYLYYTIFTHVLLVFFKGSTNFVVDVVVLFGIALKTYQTCFINSRNLRFYTKFLNYLLRNNKFMFL